MRSRRDFIIGGSAAVVVALKRSMSAQTPPSVNVTATGAKPYDWEAASPESQRMSAPAVVAALDSGEKIPALRSVVVVRNGLLVAERYYGGAAVSDLLPINSSTKSVTSMLVGLALKRKTITSLAEIVSVVAVPAMQNDGDPWHLGVAMA